MEADLNGMDERFAKAASELAELRQFPGVAKEFWPRFLGACPQLALADVCALLLGRPGQAPRWQKIGEWSSGPGQARLRKTFHDFIEQAAERALTDGSFIEEDDEGTGAFLLGLRLKLARPEDEVVLVTLVVDFTEAAARDALARLALAADMTREALASAIASALDAVTPGLDNFVFGTEGSSITVLNTAGGAFTVEATVTPQGSSTQGAASSQTIQLSTTLTGQLNIGDTWRVTLNGVDYERQIVTGDALARCGGHEHALLQGRVRPQRHLHRRRVVDGDAR